jgi:hypothetical protein
LDDLEHHVNLGGEAFAVGVEVGACSRHHNRLTSENGKPKKKEQRQKKQKKAKKKGKKAKQ